MILGKTPIQRKLISVILLTSGASLLLMGAIFMAYEFVTFKNTSLDKISTLGKIIASNSTATLAFKDKDNAYEILSALYYETDIEEAVLFDKDGNVFTYYPNTLSLNVIPKETDREGYHFSINGIRGFQPVVQDEKYYGMLYLKSGSYRLLERFYVYGGIVITVITASLLLAYFLSRKLQQGISKPIEELARTAEIIAAHHDYSVRATTLSNNEFGLLTDAFNQMLSHIEVQNRVLNQNADQLESIVESMGDAYISFDNEWRYTFINGKALELMPRRRHDLLGKVLWEVYPEMLGTDFETRFRKVMEERKPVTFETYHDSIDMWMEIRSYPHKDGISIFYTNITKYKKAEEDIKSFNEQLEQKVLERTNELEMVNKELESFSYSVSHDLRAPLRAINGYTAILVKDYSSVMDEEGIKIMKIILDSATRMGGLIDDLLHFSRLGRKELSKSIINMREMVTGIYEDLQRLEKDRDIKFTIAPLPEALADRNTIHQVWINLISNALKYSSHKEQTVIDVGFENSEQEIIYYVRDNGAGFDMRYYNKLFGVFQRLHSTKDFEGTGVGLAIVQRIIVKHGGRVWAEGKQDEGATFFFSLKRFEN